MAKDRQALERFQRETRSASALQTAASDLDENLTSPGTALGALANMSPEQAQIAGDLSQLVRGEIRARLSDRDITVFKSVGYALEDIIAAARAYAHAVRSNLGQQFLE